MIDVTEILHHWYAGRSFSEIAISLDVNRKTVRKYVTPAIEAGLSPGGAPMAQQDWARLVRVWFPGLADTRLRQLTWLATTRDRALAYVEDLYILCP